MNLFQMNWRKRLNTPKINLQVVKEFIEKQGPDTKIYLGVDSERINVDNVWYADYALCIVVHIDSKHGCKVFGEVKRERDYDQKKNKPSMRLMTEVMKVSELFQSLAEVLIDKEVEVHLDLNLSEKYGSSCVVQQAIGYIRGTCGVTPMVKHESWAASNVADRLKLILAA